MKSKLIKELIAVLAGVKESQSDVTLDLTEDNKQFVYSELLIPLMNLTNADDISQLHEKLEFLINGDADSSDYTELAKTLVNYILDDEENDTNFSEELNSLIVNCVAVLNTFNEMKNSSEEGKESPLMTLNSEIIELINEEDKVNVTNEKDENGDAASDSLVNETNNEAGAVEGEEGETEVDDDENEDEDDEPTGEATLSIVSATEKVDETPWSEINKVELKNVVKAALDESEANKAVVDEVFALVKSYDKVGDWQWPHHVVVDGEVLLNVNGLQTAALFLLKPNSSKNLTTDERTAIASHLLRHYDEVKMEKPGKLAKLVEGKESTIVINIKDEELKEFGEMFKVDAEDIGTYVGLIEALLTDFVNSGIIDIEADNAESTDSVVAVKLNKQQTEEFIKYFDIISDDIVSILSNEFDSLSYKQTDSGLETRFNESISKIKTLEDTVVELKETIELQQTKLGTASKAITEQQLNQIKFQSIIDFIKSSDAVDETIIQFVTNVIEAESERDITYMAKIGKSFLKASNSNDLTKFVKKNSIISKFNAAEVAELLDLDNKESVSPSSIVAKNVDRLAEFLD